MRRIRYRLACSALVATLVVWPAATDRVVPGENARRAATAEHDASGAPPRAPDPAQQLREGSVLKNLPGTFQVAGDRITFCPSERDAAFPVLENLALERVWGMLESVGGRLWSVSGTVTEYRGRNYLLIERAVVRPFGTQPTARP
jgi:hypothetical protein